MTTDALQSPIEETYSDVQKLIYHMAHLFRRRHGGDFEELVAEANVVYMNVYNSFDSSKGKFTSLLCTSIYRRLLDLKRQALNRKAIWAASLDVEAESSRQTLASQVEDKSRKFNCDEFLADLSQDAASVVRLVLESPAEIVGLVDGKGGQPRNWRSTIKQHLAAIGWTASRIAESFNEIKEVLA